MNHGTYHSWRSGCRCEACKEAKRENTRQNQGPRRAARRARAIDYLGGCCAECGATDDLEFDHIDPATKEHNVATIMVRKWDRLVEELDKCQLLCRPCHNSKSGAERVVVVCKRGHVKKGTNAYVRPNGYVDCRACKLVRERRYRNIRASRIPSAVLDPAKNEEE